MAGQTLRIGLLAHTLPQQRSLRSLVEECGLELGSCLLISELETELGKTAGDVADAVDAWVLAIDEQQVGESGQEQGHGEQSLHRWLEEQRAPVIFCDGAVPTVHQTQYLAWARRLKEKLNHLNGAINLAQAETGSARQVWVLAASTGGPSAVKQFLAELPPNLGIGFIYVQHIDTGFKDTLAQVISYNSRYPAHVAEHGSVVRPDEVAVVSPDYATELLANGTFVVHRRPWSAPYSPSVDYIVANVAHSYGDRSGVIVFSGMGDDGAASSRLMRQKGGRIWVQTPDSCTSDSMPSSVLAAGCVEFQGKPHDLARELVQLTQSGAAGPAGAGENSTGEDIQPPSAAGDPR